MELQELKNMWQQYDKSIDGYIRIEYKSFKKLSIKKAQSMMFHLKLGAMIEILLNWVFMGPTIRFIIHNSSDIQYALPAVLLGLLIALTIAWNIYSLILLGTIDYEAPIVAIQKKLETFNVRNLYRQRSLLYFLYPVAQTCFIIIFCKAVLQLNVYDYPRFLLLQFISSFVFVYLAIWIMKIAPDKKMAYALDFLTEIKEFEKEEKAEK